MLVLSTRQILMRTAVKGCCAGDPEGGFLRFYQSDATPRSAEIFEVLVR